jgi:CubicO group peptidase (beta-lactamase class C family)
MLELDDPVCRHWPEFGAAGKEGIRVIDVLSHRSGLPAFASPVTVNDILDGPRLATLLAAQAPFEDPRASETYQPITFGSLCAEILRRIDGRTVGTFFAEEIAQPLELELWIGLPDELEPRVSTIELASDWAARQPTETELTADALLAHTRSNPPLDGTPLAWNMRQWHAAEIPGVNAIGSARSIARFYGCLACGGELDGVRILSDHTLRIARRAVVDRIDPLSRTPTAFGAGFGLQTDWRPFGPPGDAFGHSGLGGSIHGAWPSCRLGFSYAMNRLLAPPTVDARSTALLFALHKSLLEIA